MATVWMITLIDDSCGPGDFTAIGLRPADWSPGVRLFDPEFGPIGAVCTLAALDWAARTARYRIGESVCRCPRCWPALHIDECGDIACTGQCRNQTEEHGGSGAG